MTVMTREREALLDQLVAIAGDPLLVEEVLRTLNAESAKPPTMRELVRRILKLRAERNSLAHAPR